METKEYRLKQVTEKITKGTTPSNIGESFTEEGIMYFRSELIGKSKYIDKSDGLLFISNETHEKLKRSQIQKNDLLFSMAGIYLGKISLVGDEDFPANTNFPFPYSDSSGYTAPQGVFPQKSHPQFPSSPCRTEA